MNIFWSPGVMCFYSTHICNFRTLRHGSCTDCQQRLLSAFRFFSHIFVSLICPPTCSFGVDLCLFC